MRVIKVKILQCTQSKDGKTYTWKMFHDMSKVEDYGHGVTKVVKAQATYYCSFAVPNPTPFWDLDLDRFVCKERPYWAPQDDGTYVLTKQKWLFVPRPGEVAGSFHPYKGDGTECDTYPYGGGLDCGDPEIA